MKCSEAHHLISSALLGLPSEEDEARLNDHCSLCEGCRRLRDQNRALTAVGQETYQEERLPADFAQRVLREVRAQKNGTAPSRGSRRSRARTLPFPLFQFRRDGHYWMGSILVHAAAVLLLVGLPLANHFKTKDEPDRHPIIVDSAAASLKRIRLNAPQTAMTRREKGVPLPGIYKAEAYFVYQAPDNQFLAVYPAGGQGNPSEAILLKQFSDPKDRQRLLRLTPVESLIRLPEKMMAALWGPEKDLVVVDLMAQKGLRRLEIWSKGKWESYRQSSARLGPGTIGQGSPSELGFNGKRCKANLCAAVTLVNLQVGS